MAVFTPQPAPHTQAGQLAGAQLSGVAGSEEDPLSVLFPDLMQPEAAPGPSASTSSNQVIENTSA